MAINHNDYNGAIIIKQYNKILDDDGKSLRLHDVIQSVKQKSSRDLLELRARKNKEMGLIEASQGSRSILETKLSYASKDKTNEILN